MNELRDIKPNLAVPDPLFWSLMGILMVVLIAILVFLMFKFIKKDKTKLTLKNLDLTKSKSASYIITKYSPNLIKTKEQMAKFQAILEILEPYKYQKTSPNFSKDDEDKIKEFLNGIL